MHNYTQTCPDHPFGRAFCDQEGSTTTVNRRTLYDMVVEIGDRIYEIQSDMRLPVGSYKAPRDGDAILFLVKDKKGNPAVMGSQDLWRRLKQSKTPE